MNYIGPDAVLLLSLDGKKPTPQPFHPDHAEKLLAYPGSRWKAAEQAGKPEAVADETAAAADSLPADAEGEPSHD